MPAAGSKVAPAGNVPDDKVADKSAGETWKRTSVPYLTHCRPGTRMGNERSWATEMVSSTTSLPNCAATTIPSAVASPTASTWNSTMDWPGRVRTLSGSLTELLELERRTSAVVDSSTSSSVSWHNP